MIIVITGPTGVGKTKLSVCLAKKINAEVINADSMQVYKGLDIATAKIKEEEKEGVVHHLFDIAEVNDNYSVYDYQRDCRRKIEEITSRGKNIIIVGGTGLYIKSALYNYEFNAEENTYDFSNMSNSEILNKIKEYDEDIDIHVNNRQRLERALTKVMNGTVNSLNGNQKLYDFKMIGLTLDRDLLYKRIDSRVDAMVRDGLIEEARMLYDKGVYSKAIKTGIGYKELYQYFDGKITLDEALDLIKKNSRHYAKRQYTFFNNQFSMKWFNVDLDNFDNTIDEVYKYVVEE